MKNPVNDFAWLVVALPQRDARVPSQRMRPWRQAVLCLFSCYFLVAASGCSFVGGLLPGGDTMILTDVDAAGPKQITRSAAPATFGSWVPTASSSETPPRKAPTGS